MIFETRDPSQYDTKNVSLGDFWLNTGSLALWRLASLAGNNMSKGSLATWINVGTSAGIVDSLTANSGGEVFPSGGTIFVVGDGTTITAVGNPGTSTITVSYLIPPDTTFDTDSGDAAPIAGVLDIAGGTNMNTSGATNVVTVHLDSTLTGLNSITTNNLTVVNTINLPSTTTLAATNLTVTTSETFSNLGQGVVQSSSSGVISSSEGTDGQVLISSSVGAPLWANLTAGSNISIVNTSNGIMVSEGSAGGSVLIASGSTSYTGIPSTYKTLMLNGFIFVLPGTPTGSYQDIYVTLSSNNGSSYYTSYISGMNLFNNVVGNQNFTNTNGLQIGSTNNTSNGIGNVIGFNLYLYNVNNGTTPVMSSCLSSVNINGSRSFQCSTAGVCTSSLSGPINALQINFASSPSIVYSIITNLYGLL
jgi:hypothetical protein